VCAWALMTIATQKIPSKCKSANGVKSRNRWLTLKGEEKAESQRHATHVGNVFVHIVPRVSRLRAKHLTVPRYSFVLIRLVHERTRQKQKNAKTRIAQTRKICRLILGFSMRTASHTLRKIETDVSRLSVANVLRQGAKSHSISLWPICFAYEIFDIFTCSGSGQSAFFPAEFIPYLVS